MTKNINRKILISLLMLGTLSSCSSYKTSWDCPKARGIGCSSLEYADEVAREQILLNTIKFRKQNKINVAKGEAEGEGEAEAEAEKESKKILLNQDLLGDGKYEEVEIEP